MTHRKFRLDRFLSVKAGIPKDAVRLLLAQKRITINGEIASDRLAQIDYFSRITMDNILIQDHQPCYLMLHKPAGVLSATQDKQHNTVIDLLQKNGLNSTITADLHIAGRLDLNSSGLLLLTNNSDWSSSLMSPEQKVSKVYEVTVRDPISDDCVNAFEEGIYFPFEQHKTLPAKLEKLSDKRALVTLKEGKYHQIKRMFGRFRNPVLHIHRHAIGQLRLDASLLPGQHRILSEQEAHAITCFNSNTN